MKFVTFRRLFEYFLPVTLTLFMLVTLERDVDTDGAYEKLFGFPFPFISNGYAFTHHFDVYVLAMFVDLLLYFIVTVLFFRLVEWMGLKLKSHWAFISVGVIVIAFWIISFALITFESTFELVNDSYFKTTRSYFHFGTFPW